MKVYAIDKEEKGSDVKYELISCVKSRRKEKKVKKMLLIYLLLLFFWPWPTACGILIP